MINFKDSAITTRFELSGMSMLMYFYVAIISTIDIGMQSTEGPCFTDRVLYFSSKGNILFPMVVIAVIWITLLFHKTDIS